MKKVLFLVLLILSAVAFSPYLIGEKGYILIAMGEITIESTVVTALLLLTVTLFILLLLFKLLRGGVAISFNTWNKVIFFGRRRAKKDFQRGIAAYILNDYKQAEQLLAKSAEASSFGHIAYLVAADAAQKQTLNTHVKHYLAMLDSHINTVKAAGIEAILIKINLLIKQSKYKEARHLIDEYHQHIGHDHRLLSLEITLSLIEQRFEYVMTQLNLAKKHKNIQQDIIFQWQYNAYYGAFNEKIMKSSAAALTDYWQQLPNKVKKLNTVIIAYCQVLAKHEINQPIAKILLPVIKKGGDIALLKSLRNLPITQADELIKAAQKQLHKDQHNPLWLSLVAHFATNSKQWALAEKAFFTLVNLQDKQYDNTDLLAFATVLEQQGDFEKANQVLRKIN